VSKVDCLPFFKLFTDVVNDIFKDFGGGEIDKI
jgi:hypothetical protein